MHKIAKHILILTLFSCLFMFSVPAYAAGVSVALPRAEIIDHKLQSKFSFDNDELMPLEITYPEIKLAPDSPIAKDINNQYAKEARLFNTYASGELISRAIEDHNNAVKSANSFFAYDAVMKYNVVMNERFLLSTYSDQYTYCGGAHGTTIRLSDNWNLKTGKHLQLKDLCGKNYRNLVLQQVLLIADKQIKEADAFYFDDYQRLIKKAFNPESFYLTPKGLAVYYQQYDIAPYAAGIVVFEIPYENLGIKIPG